MKTAYPALIGLIVFLVYCWGINGHFQFDDYPNIVHNERLHIKNLNIESITKASLSSSSGKLRRPISMMSFSINYYFSKLNPFSYKITNLVIHIINSIGIYFLCLLLFEGIQSKTIYIKNHHLAFLIAIAWGVHPINLTAVLYVIQRMTSLGTLFTICAIGLYLKGRKELTRGYFKQGGVYLTLVVLFGLLGTLSKENNSLLFVYIFIIECVLYREEKHSKIYKQLILIFHTIFLFLPLSTIIIYSLNNPEWITRGYSEMPFSLYERSITELRIVWIYISWILIPNNKSLGFFHDDITLSKSLTDATLPLLAGTGHLLIIGIIFILWKTKKQPFFVLGISIFYASHLIESTILPLIITFEHRNYFGSFGLLLAIYSFLFSTKETYKKMVLLFASIYILCLMIVTTQRALTWGDGINNALVDVEHHPESAASHYELGRQYSILNDDKYAQKAEIHFKKSSELNNKLADPLFALLMQSGINNTPLEKEIINKLSYRLRNSPIYASHVTWMSVISKCYLKNTCAIKSRDITTILQAALDNSLIHNSPLKKSYYLMITANLLANSENNYKQALELSLIAANTSPNEIKFAINVVNLALTYEDYTTAEQWILILKERYSKLYPQEITALENRLYRPITNRKDSSRK
jgi:hypothetical protein